MDKYDKIILLLVIGALSFTISILGIAFYIVWKAVFGA